MKSAAYVLAGLLVFLALPFFYGVPFIGLLWLIDRGGWWVGVPVLIVLAPFAWKALKAIRAQEISDHKNRRYY